MDVETKTLLEANLKRTEEVLKLSKKIHRNILLGRVLKTIKYLIILVVLVIGFFQLQPYLGTIYELFGQAIGTAGDLKNLSNPEQLLQGLR